MKIALIVVGLFLAAMGALWALQGVGLVGGSPMTGQTKWLYIGIVVLLAGIALAAWALRIARRG